LERVDIMQVCERCVLPDTFPRISFDKEGVCSVCRDYDQWTKNWKSNQPEQRKILEKICREVKNKHKEFDALVPLSGGKDSTYVLNLARKELNLNCLAYTLDFGYLSDHAKMNIEKTCKALKVDHVYYRFDSDLMHRLFALFIRKTGWFCSACMRAIGMGTSVVADMYNVPLIIGGTSPRTELPLSREMFQGGSEAHIRNVLKGEPIAAECKRLYRSNSKRRKLGYLLFLVSGKKHMTTYAWFNMADFANWNYDVIYNTIREELDWQSPRESEHMDCTIHPIQKYIHNRRFPGLEQERLLLARLVMAGQISREDALHKLEEPISQCPKPILDMFLRDVNMSKEEFDNYIDMGPRHLNFSTPSSFEKLKMKVFPYRNAGTY
jgi:hypothetical protein